MPESRYSEDLRQLEHLAPIAFAFFLRFLSWPQAIGCGLIALLYGLFVSSRLWRITSRPGESKLWFSPGKVAYATGILGLLLVFRDANYIVGAVWANLSVGDAASNVIGRKFGRKRIIWNPDKTWLGTLAGFLLSVPAAWALIIWNGLPGDVTKPNGSAWLYAIAVSLACSLVETLPLPIDDNLTICIAGGATLAVITRATLSMRYDWTALGIGLAISTGAAVIAWLCKTVSPGGAMTGILFGSVVYLAFGGGGFVILGTFFVLGSLFSRIGYGRKRAEGLAQPDGGRRAGRHVWGKGVAPFLAATAALFLEDRHPAQLAFAAATASSLCDTTATELGQLWGTRPILLNTLKPAPRGTPGAVSLAGSFSGLLAALAIALEAFQFGLISAWGVAWVLVAAMIATHLEGFLAGRQAGVRVSGTLMNAFHTTVAMLLAVLLGRLR